MSSNYVRGRSKAFGQLMGARHYCKLCNCWCALHPNAIKMHERSERHLANVEREIRRQRQTEVDTQRNEAEVAKQIAKMNAAAMSAMEKDAGLFDPRRRVTELPQPDISRPAVLSNSRSSSSSIPLSKEEEEPIPSGPPALLPPLPLALQRPPPPPPSGTVAMPPPAKPAMPTPAVRPVMRAEPVYIPQMPRIVIPAKPVEEKQEEKKPLEFIQKDDEQPSSALMSAWDETKVAAARANSSNEPKIDATTGLGTWQAVDSTHSAFGDAMVTRKRKPHGFGEDIDADENTSRAEGALAEDEGGHGAYNEDELFLGDLAKSSKFLAESEECEEQKREVLAVDVGSSIGNKHATSVSSTLGAARKQRDKRRRRRTTDDDD